jgi:hypothetical protein
MTLTVRDGLHGRGVYAGEPIAAGNLILRFSGPYLRHSQTTAETYALQIGPDLYIGGSGEMDDLVNHSCDPNAGVRIKGRTAALHAIRDIAAGEEISFDYSTTLDENDFTMECRCGSPACRVTIRDGKLLPDAVWGKYRRLGILAPYVLASREAARQGG